MAKAFQLLDKQQVECHGHVFTLGDFQQDWLPGLSFEGFLGEDDGGQDGATTATTSQAVLC